MSERGADTEEEKRRSMAERGVYAEEDECEQVRSYKRKRFLFFVCKVKKPSLHLLFREGIILFRFV